VIVLDSVGVGALQDAGVYGDEGSNTLGNIARQVPLRLPTLRSLGLDHIVDIGPGAAAELPRAAIGRMAEASKGKDSVTGHWEMMGVVLDRPFPVFPNGFPRELIDAFEQRIGRGTLGNYAASGTKIIDDLGAEHMRTGKPIVYTSADSVFQIACHEESFGLERLYKLSEIARKLVDDYNIGRVIARPFVGTDKNDFVRTGNRRDLTVLPPSPTVLDKLVASGGEVIGIGKIADIYAHQGISRNIKATGNPALFDATLQALATAPDRSIVFTNFVDFDMLYGHRRDIEGYAKALEYFDGRLPELLDAMQTHDLLIVCADHGCDPAWPGSDHTREHIPVLAFGGGVPAGFLGARDSFADIGQSLAGFFNLSPMAYGRSFLH